MRFSDVFRGVTVPLQIIANFQYAIEVDEAIDRNTEVAMAENTAEPLRAFLEEWVRLSIAGNWDKIISMVTDDVVFLPPGQSIVEGKQAVLAWFYSFPPIRSFNFELVKTEGSADFAWVRTAFDMTVESSRGKLTNLIGKGTNTYRKQSDGTWLMASDVWNFDNPTV